MNWVILISVMVLIATISWKYSSGVFEFIFFGFILTIIAAGLGGLVGMVMSVREYHANVYHTVGCKPVIVESEKQFEVWRKEKHGGTYSKLRYSISKNEFGITNIEYAPGDIIPSKKENNTIMVEVIKVTNDVVGTTEYSVNNQSRNCL